MPTLGICACASIGRRGAKVWTPSATRWRGARPRPAHRAPDTIARRRRFTRMSQLLGLRAHPDPAAKTLSRRYQPLKLIPATQELQAAGAALFAPTVARAGSEPTVGSLWAGEFANRAARRRRDRPFSPETGRLWAGSPQKMPNSSVERGAFIGMHQNFFHCAFQI